MDTDDNYLVTTQDFYTEYSNFTFLNETTFASDFDIDDFLLQSLGPKRLPLNWLIPLTVVYSIIFLTGIVGNICTCLVIARNQYMQTATNCYLFNLAIADMMTLLFDEEAGEFWYQRVSRTPASTNDVMHLQEHLDLELARQGANEIGLCDIRRKLYDQAFDELIRQEIIVCPERGRLLRMIRRETELSLISLLNCYESGIAYGIKKKLSFCNENAGLTSQVTESLSKISNLNDIIRDLEPEVAEIKITIEKWEAEKQEEFDALENEVKKENESLLAALMGLIKVNIELES